jgi:hypothetical protein
MMMYRRTVLTALALGILATPALAYIGPGAGIGALGTIAAALGAIVLLIVGFVWYPVKRLLRGRKTVPDKPLETETK